MTTENTAPEAQPKNSAPKKTVSKKAAAIALVATAVAFSAGAAGITAAVMSGNQADPWSIGESGAQATSQDIWFNIKGVPEGWVDPIANASVQDRLEAGQLEKFAMNNDGTCSYTARMEKVAPHEFDGLGSDYQTVSSLVSYGVNRDAIDPQAGIKEVETSEGKIPFQFASFGIKMDVDGDKEQEETKSYYLAHTFTEILDEDGNAPMIQMHYQCNDAGQWSETKLDELLEATTINISGDEAPAVDTSNNVTPEPVENAESPEAEESEASDESESAEANESEEGN